MKFLDKLTDKYLAFPIGCDIILSGVIWWLSKYYPIFYITNINRANEINILPNIINTDVSLAGFILAALTIIVTFKSSLKVKGVEDATNALELIFSTHHYENIIGVFKKSLIEFIICFVLLFMAWSLEGNLSTNTIYRINITGIILTSFAIIRSLFILFVILGLSKHKEEE